MELGFEGRKKLKRKAYRFLSLFLCFCMCFAQLPFSAAAAAETDSIVEPKQRYTSVNEIPQEFSGAVVTYNDLGEGKIRLDFGLYNVPEFVTYQNNIRFDKAVVAPADVTGKILPVNSSGTLSAANTKKTVVGVPIPENILSEDGIAE